MKNEIKDNLLAKLIPSEKSLEEASTKDDQKIIIGWNLYRYKLLQDLHLIERDDSINY